MIGGLLMIGGYSGYRLFWRLAPYSEPYWALLSLFERLLIWLVGWIL